MRLKIFIYSGPILPPSIGTEAAAAAADKLRFPPKLLWVVKENSSKLFSNSSDLICPQRTINLKLNFLFLKKKMFGTKFRKNRSWKKKKSSAYFSLLFISVHFCVFDSASKFLSSLLHHFPIGAVRKVLRDASSSSTRSDVCLPRRRQTPSSRNCPLRSTINHKFRLRPVQLSFAAQKIFLRTNFSASQVCQFARS